MGMYKIYKMVDFNFVHIGNVRAENSTKAKMIYAKQSGLPVSSYIKYRARKMTGDNIFTSSDLARIQRNTNKNYNSENYLFIAKKTGFPTARIKRIIEISKNRGYNPNQQETHEYYEDLMEYLQKKLSQKEYRAVYSRL